MDLYYDLGLNRLVRGPNDYAAVDRLVFSLDQGSDIRLRYLRDRVVVALEEPAIGKFGLKEQGKYDGEFIVAQLPGVPEGTPDEGWVKVVAGDDVYYRFNPEFTTDELYELIGRGGGPENDKASVTLMGDIKWTAAGVPGRTQVFTAVVRNIVINDNEGLPPDPNPVWGDPVEYLKKAGNLAGVADVAAARENLGLGDVLEDQAAIEKKTTFGDNEKIFGTEYLSSWHKKVMAGAATKLQFIGDSTTAGQSIVDPANKIDQVVLRNLNQFLTNVTVTNYGVGATNTYQWANDLSGAHSVEVQLLENPDLWFFHFGINDSNWSDTHPFQEAVDRLEAALRQGLQKIRDTQGDESVTAIVVMSPNTAIGGSQTLAWKEATNHIFRDVCREFKCAFIDIYGLWSDPGDPEADCDYLDNANGGHYHPLDVMNLWVGGVLTDVIFPFSLRALNSNKRQNGQYDFIGDYTLDVTKTMVSITRDSVIFCNKDQPTNQKRMRFYFAGDKLYLLSPNDNDSGFVTVAVFDHSAGLYLGGNFSANGNIAGSNVKRGAGSPEGVVVGVVGDFYQRTDGGAGTSFYVKESGTGNTGWVAK